jgi:hypothetical protein
MRRGVAVRKSVTKKTSVDRGVEYMMPCVEQAQRLC